MQYRPGNKSFITKAVNNVPLYDLPYQYKQRRGDGHETWNIRLLWFPFALICALIDVQAIVCVSTYMVWKLFMSEKVISERQFCNLNAPAAAFYRLAVYNTLSSYVSCM